jgi:hypothetical protein
VRLTTNVVVEGPGAYMGSDEPSDSQGIRRTVTDAGSIHAVLPPYLVTSVQRTRTVREGRTVPATVR